MATGVKLESTRSAENVVEGGPLQVHLQCKASVHLVTMQGFAGYSYVG